MRETKQKKLSDEEEEELANEFQQYEEDEFDAGLALKEKVIPNAVDYYLNFDLALGGEGEEMEGEEMEGEHDDEEGDEGEEKPKAGFKFDFN